MGGAVIYASVKDWNGLLRRFFYCMADLVCGNDDALEEHCRACGSVAEAEEGGGNEKPNSLTSWF